MDSYHICLARLRPILEYGAHRIGGNLATPVKVFPRTFRTDQDVSAGVRDIITGKTRVARPGVCGCARYLREIHDNFGKSLLVCLSRQIRDSNILRTGPHT